MLNFIIGAVVGGFVTLFCMALVSANKRAECVDSSNSNVLYAWHISNLVIYDKPKELSEFKKINRECWYADLGLAKRDCPECKNAECFIQRPPQSWCYVESVGV